MAFIFLAEMAMATLHETILPNVEPPHILHLSLSPDLRTSNSSSNTHVHPLFLKSFARHPLHDLTAQDLFEMFRPAGAIRLIQTNVDVGYHHLVSVIEYHARESTSLAINILRGALAMRSWPDCKLQAYEPANLYISVRNLSDILKPSFLK
jgi:hypothetical protein